MLSLLLLLAAAHAPFCQLHDLHSAMREDWLYNGKERTCRRGERRHRSSCEQRTAGQKAVEKAAERGGCLPLLRHTRRRRAHQRRHAERPPGCAPCYLQSERRAARGDWEGQQKTNMLIEAATQRSMRSARLSLSLALLIATLDSGCSNALPAAAGAGTSS